MLTHWLRVLNPHLLIICRYGGIFPHAYLLAGGYGFPSCLLTCLTKEKKGRGVWGVFLMLTYWLGGMGGFPPCLLISWENPSCQVVIFFNTTGGMGGFLPVHTY